MTLTSHYYMYVHAYCTYTFYCYMYVHECVHTGVQEIHDMYMYMYAVSGVTFRFLSHSTSFPRSEDTPDNAYSTPLSTLIWYPYSATCTYMYIRAQLTH